MFEVEINKISLSPNSSDILVNVRLGIPHDSQSHFRLLFPPPLFSLALVSLISSLLMCDDTNAVT